MEFDVTEIKRTCLVGTRPGGTFGFHLCSVVFLLCFTSSSCPGLSRMSTISPLWTSTRKQFSGELFWEGLAPRNCHRLKNKHYELWIYVGAHILSGELEELADFRRVQVWALWILSFFKYRYRFTRLFWSKYLAKGVGVERSSPPKHSRQGKLREISRRGFGESNFSPLESASGEWSCNWSGQHAEHTAALSVHPSLIEVSYIIYVYIYIYIIYHIYIHISYIIYHISYIIYHISYIIYHISYIIYHIYIV